MRIATFNIENLDISESDRNPRLEDRIPILANAINRLNADILCLQEVHGQETSTHSPDSPDRKLSALAMVLKDTAFSKETIDWSNHMACTTTSTGVYYDKRNLVVLSRYPIDSNEQLKNTLISDLQYQKITQIPASNGAETITWERPIQHVTINVPNLGKLHVINLHLKSRLSSRIKGQYNSDKYSWKSAAAWAEGYFLSSMKRVGQAVETRVLIDSIFDAEPDANILVCGDFNAEPGEVPVEAIAGRVENTGNTGLVSRVLIPCSRLVPQSLRYTHLHHGQPNLLDHIMASRNLVQFLQDTRIHNENLHDESLPFAFDSKFPESDHAPFLATFII